MSMQVALAAGIVRGRVHTEQDPAVLRDVELARETERRDRGARRLSLRRG